MGKINSIADKEWEEILKSMRISYPIKNTGNFIEDYFNTMKIYIDKIRNTTYFQTLNSDDEKDLRNNLYDLCGMFVCFWSNINEYRRKYDVSLPYQDKETLNKFLPGVHNYNSFLSPCYKMTPNLFDNFYSKYVDSIEEFIESKGKLPKYLYNIYRKNDYYYVQKLQLFREEDIPKELREKHKNLSLPNYYQINGQLASIDFYESKYKNDTNGHWRDAFFNCRYPIFVWINDTICKDKPITKEERFLKRCIGDDAIGILHYIAHKDKDEELNPYEIYRYAAIKEEDVIKILEELTITKEQENSLTKVYKKDGKYYCLQDAIYKEDNSIFELYS